MKLKNIRTTTETSQTTFFFALVSITPTFLEGRQMTHSYLWSLSCSRASTHFLKGGQPSLVYASARWKLCFWFSDLSKGTRTSEVTRTSPRVQWKTSTPDAPGDRRRPPSATTGARSRSSTGPEPRSPTDQCSVRLVHSFTQSLSRSLLVPKIMTSQQDEPAL